METFIFKPSFDVLIEKDWGTIISQYETPGVEQRRTKGSVPIRIFTFNFGVRTLAQIKQIEDFYDARKGAFEAFTWIDPTDSTNYTVRFVPGSFKKQGLGRGSGKGYASLALQFQEVL